MCKFQSGKMLDATKIHLSSAQHASKRRRTVRHFVHVANYCYAANVYKTNLENAAALMDSSVPILFVMIVLTKKITFNAMLRYTMEIIWTSAGIGSVLTTERIIKYHVNVTSAMSVKTCVPSVMKMEENIVLTVDLDLIYRLLILELCYLSKNKLALRGHGL